MKYLWSVFLLLYLGASSSGENKEEGGGERNIVFPDQDDCRLSLRIRNTSSDSVSVSWDYPCEDPRTSYKLHYSHAEWIACPYGTRSYGGRGFAETQTNREFTLSGLIPYSRYRISVKAFPGNPDKSVQEDFLIAETRSLPPQVMFGRSALDTKAERWSLQFFWRDPLSSRCKDFHGDITQGKYVFRGEDSWNLHDQREGTFSIDENSREFPKLVPFSRYSLRLYTLNHEGQMNPQALILTGQTLPSFPPRPIHLEVLDSSSSDDSVPLRWQPGYPPTGSVLRYVVKWKISEAAVWLSSLSIPASMARTMCDDNAYQYNCYSIPELNTKHNLTFVITAYNEGVPDNSEWSDEAQFLSNATSTTSPVVPPESEDHRGRGSLAIWEILLIVLFSLVALALILGFLWIKCINGRERKYLSVPIYHMSKGKSDSPRILSSPLTRELSKSIQNVPLPPVPGGEHVYEELPPGKAKNLEYDEEMYLRPNKLSGGKSEDSLDVSEYLVPTFPVVTDVSKAGGGTPETFKPPSPIPIRSYEQKTLDSSKS